MTNPLDLEPIRARVRASVEEGWNAPADYLASECDALVAEVERLRDEADNWRDSTHHLSKVRAREGGTSGP